MADTRSEASGIFRKSAMNRLNSAEDLDRYIKVTNPSVWLVLGAIVLLLIALFVWSFTAVIPTMITRAGYVEDGKVVFFLDAKTYGELSDKDQSDDYVVIDGQRTSISEMGTIPLAKGEVQSLVDSAYIFSSLDVNDWNYLAKAPLPQELSDDYKDDAIVPVGVVFSESNPISYLIN